MDVDVFSKLSPAQRKATQQALMDAANHLHALHDLPRDALTDEHHAAFKAARGHARALDAIHGLLSQAAQESENDDGKGRRATESEMGFEGNGRAHEAEESDQDDFPV